jgi:hypothetical protein
MLYLTNARAARRSAASGQGRRGRPKLRHGVAEILQAFVIVEGGSACAKTTTPAMETRAPETESKLTER